MSNFSGGGGGGRVQVLISIETHRTCDFPGGGAVCPNIPDFTLYILPPWICHNGIGPTTVSNNFVTVRDIGYSEKIWGYLPVHEGYLPVYFKEYCYPPPPPSKQASTIHRYFVSATPHTVIRLL